MSFLKGMVPITHEMREVRNGDKDFQKIFPHVYRMFERVVQEQEKRPAYLLVGPSGIGKAEFGLFFARSFLCGVMPPCGFCLECQYVEHPDILLVKRGPDDERLKVDAVRSALSFAFVPPYSHHKFIIVKDAHLMTQQGFSALLKALEETKPHSTFILTTSRLELVPSTVISRCIRVRLMPNFDELIEDRIKGKGLSDEMVRVLRNISMFNLPVMEKEEKDIERIWKILSFIVYPDTSVSSFLEAIDEIREPEDARDVLDALESFVVKNSEKLGKFGVDLWEKIKSARQKLELFINPKAVILSLIF